MFRAATAYVMLFAAVGAYSPFLQQYYQSLGIPLPAIGLLASLAAFGRGHGRVAGMGCHP